jgi:hypothetical protein
MLLTKYYTQLKNYNSCKNVADNLDKIMYNMIIKIFIFCQITIIYFRYINKYSMLFLY